MPKLRNGNNGVSNPGSLDCESGILPTELPRSIVIPALHSRPSERNQISDRYGTDSDLKQFDPHDPRGGARGDFRGSKIQKSGNVMNCPENQ